MIVTATPTQHQRIQELIGRLDEAGVTAARPVRTFVIKNRSVIKIVELLEHLIGVGALSGGAFEPTFLNQPGSAPPQTTIRRRRAMLTSATGPWPSAGPCGGKKKPGG